MLLPDLILELEGELARERVRYASAMLAPVNVVEACLAARAIGELKTCLRVVRQKLFSSRARLSAQGAFPELKECPAATLHAASCGATGAGDSFTGGGL